MTNDPARAVVRDKTEDWDRRKVDAGLEWLRIKDPSMPHAVPDMDIPPSQARLVRDPVLMIEQMEKRIAELEAKLRRSGQDLASVVNDKTRL